MSLEPNLAALVAASTKLTKSITMPLSEVNGKRDAATTAQADITAAAAAFAAASATATTDAVTTASKLSAAAADYAAQKTTKGLAAVQTSADSELKDRLHRRDPARHPFRGARPSLVMDFVRRECHRNNAAGNLEPVDLSTFMTFTRGSTATYVGPDGLIKTAGVNEARYGYDPVTGEALGLLVEEQRTNFLSASDPYWWSYNGAVYVMPRATLAPNGTLSAARVIGTSLAFGNGVWKSCTISATGTITLSVYIKAVATGGIRLSAKGTSINNGSCCEAYFAPLSGYSVSGVTAGSTASSVNVGGGWYRLWLTAPATSTTDVRLVVYGWDNTMFTDFYIWGAQVEAGSFPTSYIPTPATFTGRASTKTYFDSNGVMQTAASGVAVTDHGYVDGRWVSKGLSLEPRATNVVTYSSGSNTTAYGADSTTSVNAAAVGGIGLSTFVSTSGFSRRITWFGTSLGTGNVVASLFIAKQTGSVTLGFTPWEGSTSGATAVALDMGTGVGVLTKGLHTTASLSVEDCGSLWRVSVALTYLSGNYTLGTFYFTSTLTSLTLGGLQAETGPVATSYIPTTAAQVTRAADTSTSAQVTRAADSAVSTQAAALYNLDAGTTCVEAKYSNRGVYPGLYSWNNDYFIFTATAVNQLILNGRGNAGTMVLTPPAVDTTLRHAVRRNRLNLKSAVNNSALTGASLSLSPTTTVTMLHLGVGGTEYWNGYIRQLTYFPRQLSDADLQALTILED